MTGRGAGGWQRGRYGDVLRELLEAGVREGTFPTGSAWVWHDGQVVGETAVGLGHVTVAPEALRYDIASITKPRAIGVLAMAAVTAGTLDLDRPLFQELPPHLTARGLLGHRGGLDAWKAWADALPVGFRAGTPRTRYALSALVRQAARDSVPMREAIYSDIGFMLLQQYFEQQYGRRLRELVSGFRPPRPARHDRRGAFVGCGFCPTRGREVVGEVHDPQAWAFGGDAGHAGLFATAADIGRFGMDLLEIADGRRGQLSDGTVIAPEIVRQFWSPESSMPHVADWQPSTWALGWDRPSPGASSAGRTVAADAVGHLGFTGTSLWLEPSRRLVMVLLTNRVVFGAPAQPLMKRFRPHFHDTVRVSLGLAATLD